MSTEDQTIKEISRRSFIKGSLAASAAVTAGGVLWGPVDEAFAVDTAPIKAVDVHSHFLVPEYIDALKKAKVENEDGFPMPKWSEEDHLSFMDQAEIELSILSLSTPHIYLNNDNQACDLARTINEVAAKVKQKYPRRFGFTAVLPTPDVEGSLKEIAYAYDVLKADGIKVASNSKGVYLGDPKLDPIFEELNKRKAVVIIHPSKPQVVPEGAYTSGPMPLFEYIGDTTRAVINLITSGTIMRYPDIKIVVPHCGSFLPCLIERISGVSAVLGKPVNAMESAKKLYYDLAGDPLPRAFDALLTFADPHKIMYGGDFPYTPPAAIIGKKKALMAYPAMQPYKAAIFRDNAIRLFRPYYLK